MSASDREHFATGLKPHHVKVLQLICRAHRNHEIADLLGYTTHTIENYVSEILSVTGYRNRSELIILCIATRLVAI